MSIAVYARRNSDLARLGEIDDYRRLSLSLKFNEASKWVLELDAASPLANYLDVSGGIIVERDDEVILSGLVEGRSEQYDERGHVLTVSGSDDSVWLSRRIVFPAAWPFSATAYDTNTAAAETNLHYYVNKNAGPGADAERRVPGLVMGTDNGAGSSTKGRGRLQELNVLLQKIALAGGDLRYQIVQVDDTLEFQVYDPQDLTDSVQFSPDLGNLAGFIYERTAPTINYAFVGGGGQGASRTFRRGDDSPSVAEWGRSEAFIDRRDTTDTDELDQTITEELAEGSETVSLAISPIDTPAMTFGTHYNRGDRVRVITATGIVIEDALREVNLTYDEQGESIEPVVGTPGAVHPRVPAIYKKRKQVEKRTKDLERI